MTAAGQPQIVTLRSGEVVQIRQVQPDDASALVRAYANLGEQTGQGIRDLLTAVGRGDIVAIPVLLRRLIRVPDGLAHLVRLPVSSVLKALRPGSSAL